MIDDLYSAKLLKLAANMPRAGRLPAPDASSEKIAKLCGSRVTVDVVVEGDRVADFAQDVKACALGQASASVLGEHVLGASLAEIEMARDQFRAMLKQGADAPVGRFADLSMLAPVKDYKLTLSPLIGRQCRFLPSCSEYAAEALILHGAWRGSWLATRRLCRCNPWGGAGYDPVPQPRDKTPDGSASRTWTCES